MSGSKFQLTPPFSGWQSGYRRPSPQGPQLTLSPEFAASLLGWSVMGRDLQVYNLMLTLPKGDDALRSASAALSQAAQKGTQSDLQPALPTFMQALTPDALDTLYGLMRQLGASTWADIPSAKTNVATGNPASGGKLTPSGVATPTSADGAIAGVGIPLPAIKLGKRFSLSSSLDVHLYVYADKDAFADDMRLFISGGGIGFESKTSDGTKLKLRLGAGRDQAGGASGFIRLQIGPDYVAGPTPP